MNGWIGIGIWVALIALALLLVAVAEATDRPETDREIDPDLLQAWDEAIGITRTEYDR